MKPSVPELILTHYNCSLPTQYSPEEFYKIVEEKITNHEVELIKTSRVDLHEKGAFSRKRTYLRARQGDLIFDICGAPYGNNMFFISYWLGQQQKKGCLVALFRWVPIIGDIIDRSSDKLSYYELDTAAMFQTFIHDLVLETTDEVAESNKVEPIPEEDRKANTSKLEDF